MSLKLWVEVTQIVCVPSVICLCTFFVDEPIYSWLDHVHHYEWAVPLGLQLALLDRLMNKHHVSWIDILLQNLLVSPGLGFFIILIEV